MGTHTWVKKEAVIGNKEKRVGWKEEKPLFRACGSAGALSSLLLVPLFGPFGFLFKNGELDFLGRESAFAASSCGRITSERVQEKPGSRPKPGIYDKSNPEKIPARLEEEQSDSAEQAADERNRGKPPFRKDIDKNANPIRDDDESGHADE